MPRPQRSVLVSWLLGAAAGALVTLSFEALSAREPQPGRCPVTGATAGPASSAPEGRCPATGAAPARPAVPGLRA